MLILALAFVLGLLIAMGETGSWDLILRFVYQSPYGGNDPLFDKDIGFYLFSLPVYVAVKNWLLWILLLATLMTGSIYFTARRHQSRSSSQALFGRGSRSWLRAARSLFLRSRPGPMPSDRYLMLYDDNGVVVGAGYADVHVELPALWLLSVRAVVAAIAAWANVRLRTIRLLIAAPLLSVRRLLPVCRSHPRTV